MRASAFLIFFAIVVPGAAFGGAGIDYPSAWECDQARFNWYCDLPPEQKQQETQRAKEKPKSKEELALERLEAKARRLKELRALAILEPTPEHIAAYIRAQEETMQMAATFSDVWRRVVWQNPDLNYELKRPVNNAAIDTYNKVRREAEMKVLDEIKKDWGIFFFFRSDCPYCHRMAPTLRFLSDMYGITVFPVTLDGRGLPEYPDPRPDNGMARMLNITQVPMLVLGNVRDRRLIPLGSGVISAQDVIERIYILAGTKPGELY
ncbi:conjugal transfer protein TraF [Pelomicrobium methylotrophicum]|nr:conjugal transfer protein TraF [Pelomicrobium methylotrophicum]